MASASTAPDLPSEQWYLAKYGITLFINNRATEAQELFQINADSFQMAAGYAFVTFMDALMSFEDEKLQLALNVLRDTEKKCATDIGWLKSVKCRMFGGKTQSLAERLENQIILADTQVCVAILTFLQQEFSGYLKGGWVLRKAWKIYHQTYMEIVNIYKDTFGEFNLPEPTDFEWQDSTTISTISSTTDDSPTCEWTVPNSNAPSPSHTQKKNGYVHLTNNKLNIPHSQSTYVFTKNSTYFPFSIKRSNSSNSSLSTNGAGTKIPNSKSAFTLLSPFTTHISYLTNTLNLLASTDKNDKDIEPETISRLMSAVCFGYGVLQLGMSLLPPSLLKITNFLGFSGNRTAGISNLMYARKGSDMRAPLSTLALLWYHTIVRPFYALDGNNVKAGLEAATLLMQESAEEYGQSALFLFFKGRIHRLDSDIQKALVSFQAAVENSSQREIKLLALHEVGWCHLINLDYAQAHRVFMELQNGSRWSRAYYTYLVIICSGSCNIKEFSHIKELRDIYSTNVKSTQLDVYLQRRIKFLPIDSVMLESRTQVHWKFFVYELIYLWNALPSCSNEDISDIIKDCYEVNDEPMAGLAMLIQGECFTILGAYENAITSLRNCLTSRPKTVVKDDVHISAFAEYALGALLIKNEQTKEEGKVLLQHTVSEYKDYDFDNKLHVRIDMLMKSLS